LSVIVVPNLQRAESSLRDGGMRCPHCQGRLRPYGFARTRTVRGVGSARLRVTPRRARCADCRATQVLLPGQLICRRADSTEVIGHALAAKATTGAGHRSIAARLGRPVSTVRRWLRRAPEPHAQWLYQQAVQRCADIDRELLAAPPSTPMSTPAPTLLAQALNLLAGAALRYRDRFGLADPPWALIGAFSYGYLLAPPMIT
jgi:transposase-like protein